MGQIEIIVVEDNIDQQEIIKASADAYEIEYHRTVKLCFYDNAKEAIDNINGNYDGVILDMKLHDDQEAGSTILSAIEASSFRVPVIFVTAYPDLVSQSEIILRCRARAEGTYRDDFDLFFDLYHTGITKIMGGRGKIEETLKVVFAKSLMPKPQRDTWIAYGKTDSPKTEKALLRFTLNHLMQLLEDDEDKCFPEEMYICPPFQKGFKTGSIVKQKEGSGLCIVLNPACDLVMRTTGQMKTDRLLLVEIDDETKAYKHILEKLATEEERNQALNKFFSNIHSQFYHWLPTTTFFPGGFINFRKLSSTSMKQCLKSYDLPHVQVSSHFVKDILSRFSSYYSRQGQPDIEYSHIITKTLAASESAE